MFVKKIKLTRTVSLSVMLLCLYATSPIASADDANNVNSPSSQMSVVKNDPPKDPPKDDKKDEKKAPHPSGGHAAPHPVAAHPVAPPAAHPVTPHPAAAHQVVSHPAAAQHVAPPPVAERHVAQHVAGGHPSQGPVGVHPAFHPRIEHPVSHTMQRTGLMPENAALQRTAPTRLTRESMTHAAINSAKSLQLTNKNIQHSSQLHNQFMSDPRHAKWTKTFGNFQRNYQTKYHDGLVRNNELFGAYYNDPHYHDWYQRWNDWGFYGGFWYPFYPCYNIDDYFYYPAVYWFFVESSIPSDYYSDYYPREPTLPSQCLTTFPYANIYYPTITLRDLLVEMSGFSTKLLCNFRAAIIQFTSQLQQNVATNFNIQYQFNNNSVVITHYQNLNNQSIVLVGYVSDNNIHMAFEGVLNLNNPDQSIAFAPKGQEPTSDQINALTQINNQIKSLGGSTAPGP